MLSPWCTMRLTSSRSATSLGCLFLGTYQHPLLCQAEGTSEDIGRVNRRTKGRVGSWRDPNYACARWASSNELLMGVHILTQSIEMYRSWVREGFSRRRRARPVLLMNLLLCKQYHQFMVGHPVHHQRVFILVPDGVSGTARPEPSAASDRRGSPSRPAWAKMLCWVWDGDVLKRVTDDNPDGHSCLLQWWWRFLYTRPSFSS